MAFIEFADLITTITDYAFFVLIAALIYYGYLIFKGGTEGRRGSDAAKSAGEGIGKGAEWVAEKWKESRKKSKEKEEKVEKFSLKEYVDLEDLKKAVGKVKEDKDFKKLRHKDRRAKRDERRAYRFVEQLKEAVNDLKLTGAAKSSTDKDVTEIEAFNNIVVKKIKEFEDDLAKPLGAKKALTDVNTKKTTLIGHLDAALSAEISLQAALKDLRRILKI